jgi:plasmid segregation protein ParM
MTGKKKEVSNLIYEYFKANDFLETLIEITGKTEEEIKTSLLSVGGLDIGYGNTKYIAGISDDFNLICDHFPSLTPIAPNVDMSGGLLNRRNTKIIELDGNRYEVGKDTEMTANTVDSGRVLSENYIFSEQYHALFLGALDYMNVEVYDVLVMGLPVKFMHNAAKLVNKFEGIHKLSNDRTCEVKKIIVIPQPLGGFYDVAIKENLYEEMIDENNLVIDPGYYTYDFLLMNGLTPIENRSDALNGGMSRVLTTMSKSISSVLGRTYENNNAIDKALRKTKKIKNPETGVKEEKRVIKIGGEYLDLLPHIKNTSHVLDSIINDMTNIVQTYDDIDNIILVGGPESIFDKKIRDHLVGRIIHKSKTPLYSNVNGFFYWGVISSLTE